MCACGKGVCVPQVCVSESMLWMFVLRVCLGLCVPVHMYQNLYMCVLACAYAVCVSAHAHALYTDLRSTDFPPLSLGHPRCFAFSLLSVRKDEKRHVFKHDAPSLALHWARPHLSSSLAIP